MTRKPWTEAEIATLKAGYDTLPMPKLLAALPGRTAATIYAKHYSMLPESQRQTSKRPPRSMVERMLREEAIGGAVPFDDVLTKRTPQAVWVRYRVMQSLRKSGYTLCGIGAVMGFDHTTVLLATRKKLPATPPAMWIVVHRRRPSPPPGLIPYAGHDRTDA